MNSNLNQIKQILPANVRLVGAVKYADKDTILELVNDGLNEVGFNTLQQLLEIRPLLSEDIKIHFIGHIQGNKVNKLLLGKLDLIQSLDSLKLANKINLAAKRLGKKQECLIQIKTDCDKPYGIELGDFDEFYNTLKKFSNIRIMGIMTVPRIDPPDEVYQKMKELKDQYNFEILSMGMSGDYLKAIEHGSNMVRIGRKIFS